METPEDVLSEKESYDFLKGAKRVRVKIAMEKYAQICLEKAISNMNRTRTHARVWDGPKEMKGYGKAKDEDLKIINDCIDNSDTMDKTELGYKEPSKFKTGARVFTIIALCSILPLWFLEMTNAGIIALILFFFGFQLSK